MNKPLSVDFSNTEFTDVKSLSEFVATYQQAQKIIEGAEKYYRTFFESKIMTKDQLLNYISDETKEAMTKDYNDSNREMYKRYEWKDHKDVTFEKLPGIKYQLQYPASKRFLWSHRNKEIIVVPVDKLRHLKYEVNFEKGEIRVFYLEFFESNHQGFASMHIRTKTNEGMEFFFDIETNGFVRANQLHELISKETLGFWNGR